MKTRIISAVVASALLVAALILNSFFSITVTVCLALLSALASYEMLHNTGCVGKKAPVFAAMLFSAAVQFAYSGYFGNVILLTLVYVLFVVIFAVFDHTNFGERQITMALSMPIVISYAFSSLDTIINSDDGHGLFYFVLLFNFSCVSDICAYFVGSKLGRHKLSPVISPKKTIEGSVGGLIGSCIGTVIICIVYNHCFDATVSLPILLAVTPLLSILGMLGDLFASAIKRNYGIKDYGNIMPGHGGVLDRTDSILLIAPALAFILKYTTFA